MNNNRGFTLVELLVSFTLAMVLVVILFQLIISMKDLYVISGLKTELMNKQFLMTNKIYSDLNELGIASVSTCEDTDKCISILYSTGVTKKIVIDSVNKTISYDGYIISLNNDTRFGIVDLGVTDISLDKKMLYVNVPIFNNVTGDTNFGINIVFPYNYYS